jgi:hypothetical protein
MIWEAKDGFCNLKDCNMSRWFPKMNRWKKKQYADMGSQGGFCDLEDGNPHALAAK